MDDRTARAKTEAAPKRCNEMIQEGAFNPAAFHYCRRKPHVFADGKWWCNTHSPAGKDARDARMNAKLEARFAPRKCDGCARLEAENKRLREGLERLATDAQIIATKTALMPGGFARSVNRIARAGLDVLRENSNILNGDIEREEKDGE